MKKMLTRPWVGKQAHVLFLDSDPEVTYPQPLVIPLQGSRTDAKIMDYDKVTNLSVPEFFTVGRKIGNIRIEVHARAAYGARFIILDRKERFAIIQTRADGYKTALLLSLFY